MADRSRQTDVLLHYLDHQQQLDQLHAHGPIFSQPVPRSTAAYETPLYPAPTAPSYAEQQASPQQRGEQTGRRAARRPDPTNSSPTTPTPTRASSRASSRRRFGAFTIVAMLVAVALVIAAGVFATRKLTSPGSARLEATGGGALSDEPAGTSSATPSTSAPAGGPAADLGEVKGVYTLAGPKAAAAGSWAVLTLSGQGRRIVRTDARAPFRAAVDTRKLPNGTYTVSVLVVNPGKDSATSSRVVRVNNPAPARTTAAKKQQPENKKKAPATTSAAPVRGAGSTQAAQVVTLTNQERAEAGCQPLSVNSTLTQVAQAHSADMAKNDYFDHNSQDGRTPFTRMSKAGYSYRSAAENIAMGQQTPASVMDAWMKSPGHKANILNCGLKQIGVGYALNGNGTPYWTQDFGTPA